MADADVLRTRITEIRQRLDGGERDDDTAQLRQRIASLYLSLGEPLEAAHWYVEAAKFVEICELGLRAVALAKRAVEIAPESLEAQREYRRLWERYGPGGPPDQPGSRN